MILNENQKNMYKDCMFLNEGFIENYNEKLKEKNRRKQLKNLNNVFSDSVKKVDSKMTGKGFTVVKNFSEIKSDKNQQKIKNALKCYNHYRDGVYDHSTFNKTDRYNGREIIASYYSYKDHLEDGWYYLSSVSLVYIKKDGDKEKIEIKNATGFLNLTDKHFK